MNDWYWAARRSEVAGDRFVIANGKEALWPRVRAEIDDDEQCAWHAIHPGQTEPRIEDIVEMMFTVVPTYRVNHNRFVLEAAQIPVFARFLRNARLDLGNYVSNSAHPDELIPLEHYDANVVRRLSAIVSSTLGIDDDWAEW